MQDERQAAEAYAMTAEQISEGSRRRRIESRVVYLVLAAVVAVDQLSKIAVRRWLPIDETQAFWPGVLQFTHIENTGAAGGSFEGWGRLFIPVAIAVVAWVIYAQRRGKLENAWFAAGAGFFAGGAVGNAIDRLLFARVTDFLEWTGSRGIMNLADLAINVGVLLGIAGMLLASRRARKETGPVEPKECEAR
ncbi:signal peptidase II [Cohnella sp. JJ-181]|uniref:signal peptidase II n=1 Tax=Cohnella rhizoplanae TaxID=2974897 RepID=UPI0022FF65A7|nr:signal peptidase II [Cohnella sp. JJ-181]CAI6066031.1 Lipoprotein signal peptidase [Cohnella sp. JJ-181]